MKFKTIVIDPPWPVTKTGIRSVRPNQAVSLGYKTMSLDEIAAMPIANLAAPGCLLFIWATNSRVGRYPTYVHACHLLDPWQFNYYTTLVWSKPTGVCPFGPIQITSEYVVMGYRDKFEFDRSAMGKMKSVFDAPVSKHSEKPDSLYQSLLKFTYGPRLDVFARKAHDGFYGWGDEYEGTALELDLITSPSPPALSDIPL